MAKNQVTKDLQVVKHHDDGKLFWDVSEENSAPFSGQWNPSTLKMEAVRYPTVSVLMYQATVSHTP
jgi:hypothetical protein